MLSARQATGQVSAKDIWPVCLDLQVIFEVSSHGGTIDGPSASLVKVREDSNCTAQHDLVEKVGKTRDFD